MRSRLFSWLKIRGSLHLLGFLWNRKSKHKPWKSWFCEAMTADTLLLFEHAAGNQSWNSEWLSSSCFMNYSDRSGTGWLQALFPRADSSPPEWRCSMYSYSWRRNITEPSMNRSMYSYSWRAEHWTFLIFISLPHETLVLIRELVPALPAPPVHHVLGLARLHLVRALAEDRDLEAE